MSDRNDSLSVDGGHNICFDRWPEFAGQLIHKAAPVHYIYTDEAGTSKHEPVTVVAAVIMQPDAHWRAALTFLQDAIETCVPEDLRPGFHFHAKDIWSGYRDYDNVWPREARAWFIANVSAIPRFLEAAITLGKVRRDAPVAQSAPLPHHEWQHVLAFWGCMARANKYVRDWAPPTEVATVVAEDVPKIRKFLRNVLKNEPLKFPLTSEFLYQTNTEKVLGVIQQSHSGKIDRIIDTVHFVEKGDAPLLQIADACAFVLRRYFAGQAYGNEMVAQMLGEPLVWEDWQSPSSDWTFSFSPERRYPR